MTDENIPFENDTDVSSGDVLYTDDGDPVGVVAGFTEMGLRVEVPDGDNDPATDTGESSTPTEEPGQTFGEGYIMWRCGECGEVGELDDGLPEECPNCGADKEALYRKRED